MRTYKRYFETRNVQYCVLETAILCSIESFLDSQKLLFLTHVQLSPVASMFKSHRWKCSTTANRRRDVGWGSCSREEQTPSELQPRKDTS
ncbi:unnamed protein product [Caenorhabditis auriculariae]|uniref:Uncharacterized protein n=1 Tax=Caenorhabditis auriculariae TaxID=2777116 RepID=A0A8S1GWT1_9PELO|nr:unnamed protein product [Caenorhabditis auriculariae]